MEKQNEVVLTEAVRELTGLMRRRRRRFWIGLMVVLAAVSLLLIQAVDEEKPLGMHVARVDVVGPILADSDASADSVISSLRDAFSAASAKAVVVYINSPGGSAVQSSRIHRELLRLREKHPQMPLYAVADDLCASGAYYVASATDRIYANEASLVGSIGVISASFGFVELLEELGIDRRVTISPEDGKKAMLDPFLEQSEEAVQHLQGMLDDVHDQFRAAVLAGRGTRLAEAGEDVFDGRFWSGTRARELGLVDEFGDIQDIARSLELEEVFTYSQKEPLIDRLLEPKFDRPISQLLGMKLLRGIQF